MASVTGRAAAMIVALRPLVAAHASRSVAALALAALALAAIAIRVPTLAQPLLERHPFRQTWTAYTAVLFRDSGIDLLRPQLPVFGPPFTQPQEFPLFQALASLVMRLGIFDDTAMRVTALLCYLTTAFLLFGLVRHVAGSFAAFATFALFLFSPFGLLWSRASLIEYLVTAAMVAYVWAGLLYRERRSWVMFAVALAAGCVAMLVKPSAGMFATIPLGLAVVSSDAPGLRGWLRARLDPRFVALFAWPLALAVGWTLAADGYLLGKETTAFLAPSNVREYYLDSLAERLNVDTWREISKTITLFLIGPLFVPLLVVGAVAGARVGHRAFWIGMGLAALLPIIVLFGGYRRHDYYIAEVSWSLVAFVGLGAAWLRERVRGRLGGALLVTGAALGMVVMWTTTADYWGLAYRGQYDSELVLPRARELAALTRPDDLVVMVGRGLDPDVLYYARRRGLLLVFPNPPLGGNTTTAVFRALPSGPYGIFFSFDPARDAIDLQRSWRWNGVIGTYTYVVGASPSDLRRAPAVASDDSDAFESAARAGRSLISAPVRVPCDLHGASIPRGAVGTWLRLSSDSALTARLWVDTLLGPLPLRSIVALGPEVSPGAAAISITCTGAAAVVIEAAIDATLPGR
jgi:hypothetical protein